MRVESTALVVAGTGLQFDSVIRIWNHYENVAPHMGTTRETISIPLGRIGIIGSIYLAIRRRTAATTVGRMSAWISVSPVGPYAVALAVINRFDNTVGDYVPVVTPVGLQLPEGVTIDWNTIDLSTGGACDYACALSVWLYKISR